MKMMAIFLSLFNFLNLPDFTFVGNGLNNTLMKLESEFGLTCKNALDVGSTTWNLSSMSIVLKSLIGDIVEPFLTYMLLSSFLFDTD
ncbi:unnamed protein product [Thlaspi arvense]|uniref:Uncharacterized protein n=1 Tax=Thlaspi arvense TaxID=13288 RepID=A0AAU9SN66_THLAR|nr:unnamed protein product [Thlaspi arvense]